jgi:hypothetical protein
VTASGALGTSSASNADEMPPPPAAPPVAGTEGEGVAAGTCTGAEADAGAGADEAPAVGGTTGAFSRNPLRGAGSDGGMGKLRLLCGSVGRSVSVE